MTTPAYWIDGAAAAHAEFYAAACDPRRSAAVEACAGAGKTWMLVSRIVRALLDGARPHEILAITFTRKAAGEMRERLRDWLRDFSDPALDDARCVAELVARGVDPADAPALAPRLRGLQAELLAAGRPVQIMTFHAWFSQLLRMAPLAALAELGIAPQATLVEDASALVREAMRAFHANVAAEPGLRADHRALVEAHGRPTVSQWLAAALERRAEIELAEAHGRVESSVPSAAALWPDCQWLDDPAALIHDTRARALIDECLAAWRRIDKKTVQTAVEGLLAASDEADPQRAVACLRTALRTQAGSLRKLPVDPALLNALDDELSRIETRIRQQEAHLDHARMLRLARVLLADYARLKRRRALVDMPDLERVAFTLLGDAASAGWMAERLDSRLRHLLIDEFQDTSPLQWHTLAQWLEGYAGAGGGASGQRPLSVFIVGDPKQSIYRFRRAEPRVFEAAQRFVAQALDGRRLACDHTRRNARGVLAALNGVFGHAQAEGGYAGFRPHTTEMAHEGVGLLCLVDAEGKDGEGGGPVASPSSAAGSQDLPDLTAGRDLLRTPRREPEAVRAAREAEGVARTIAQWVAAGLAPDAIQVLARKRRTLAHVAEALQRHRVASAHADSLVLADSPEAQDVLALLDVLASPGQDLSFARALRSPIWRAGDDDLVWLARQARALGLPWWPALRRLCEPAVDGMLDDTAAPVPALLAAAHRDLARWSRLEARLPPHDLLDRIYAEADLSARYAAAVPPARRGAALAALRALLAQTLDLDSGRYASSYAFVRALRSQAVKAKLAAPPGAVQLLTIHGAKGLEAHTVFLMDASPRAPNAAAGVVLVDWPVDAAHPLCVAFVRSESEAPASLADLVEREREARATEELNALYVAMSRARDALVVSRTESRGAAPNDWWTRLREWAAPFSPEALPAPADATPRDDESARCLEIPDERLGADPAFSDPEPEGTAPTRPARIGEAFHRLMQWCGDQPGQDRPQPAQVAAARAEFGLSGEESDQALRAAAAVLSSLDFARFRPGPDLIWAGNEVPVAGTGESGDGPGRIDRLVALRTPGGCCWWVLDYKLALAPEGSAPHDAQVAQLARYAAQVRRLNPGDAVRAAWVDGRGAVREYPLESE